MGRRSGRSAQSIASPALRRLFINVDGAQLMQVSQSSKDPQVGTDHMTAVATRSPLQYLDKASSALRDMGLMPEKVDASAPVNALLEKISDLDEDKIALIARTL